MADSLGELAPLVTQFDNTIMLGHLPELDKQQILFNVEDLTDKYLVWAAVLEYYDKEHLRVEVKDGMLAVSGEVKYEKQDENSYTSSLKYASRSILLPNNVDSEKIQAKLDKGMLQIELPKATR